MQLTQGHLVSKDRHVTSAIAGRSERRPCASLPPCPRCGGQGTGLTGRGWALVSVHGPALGGSSNCG